MPIFQKKDNITETWLDVENAILTQKCSIKHFSGVLIKNKESQMPKLLK